MQEPRARDKDLAYARDNVARKDFIYRLGKLWLRQIDRW